MPVTMGGSLAFCGRPLSPNHLALIRQVTHDFPRLSLTELSRTLCELLHWRRANGALKTRECYSFLQQLQARGWLASLPPIRLTSPRRPHTVRLDAQSDPGAPLTGALGDYLPLELLLLQTLAERRLFQQYVRRYHYLGYRVRYGAQLRYFVRSSRSSRPLLACLLFTSPAWKWLLATPGSAGVTPPASFRRTGSPSITSAPCCCKPWWRWPASPALAIAPPTGSMSVPLKAIPNEP
jgi:hypothetical protein